MSSWTYVNLTGSGWQQINAGAFVAVTSYQFQLTTISTPKVRQLGTVRPYAVRYAGVVVLGISPADNHNAVGIIMHEHVIRYECEWVFMGTNGLGTNGTLNCQDIGWRLPPGVTIGFVIYNS